MIEFSLCDAHSTIDKNELSEFIFFEFYPNQIPVFYIANEKWAELFKQENDVIEFDEFRRHERGELQKKLSAF